MPTAPLRDGEEGTLLAWYLEIDGTASGVIGKKPVERGLVHRLDTPTEGLVLLAKTQGAYESFLRSQAEDLIVKRYRALCDIDSEETLSRAPMALESRFCSLVPWGREVRPVYPDDRRYPTAGRDYRTLIESIQTEPGHRASCVCSLTRGYRHQVRAHLASQGLPIVGDALYNPRWTPPSAEPQSPLMLSATGLSFPDPDSGSTRLFSLP